MGNHAKSWESMGTYGKHIDNRGKTSEHIGEFGNHLMGKHTGNNRNTMGKTWEMMETYGKTYGKI